MFDFSGLNPDEIGDGTSIDLPSGVYKATIQSCKPSQAKGTGRDQFEFKLGVAEAPYVGATRTEWISTPNAPDDKVNFIWVRAFQSIGVAPAKLKQAGSISAEQIPAFFTGKPCFFEYVKGNRDMGQKDNVRFITEAAYKAKKEQLASMANSPVTTAAVVAQSAPVKPNVVVTAAPTPAPAPAAAVGGGAADLLAMLNG